MRSASISLIFIFSALFGLSQTQIDHTPLKGLAFEAAVTDLNTLSLFDNSINFSGYDIEASVRLEFKNSPLIFEVGFFGNVANVLSNRFSWDVDNFEEDYFLVGTNTETIKYSKTNENLEPSLGSNLSEQSGFFISVGKKVFQHGGFSLEPHLRAGIRNVNFTIQQDRYLKNRGENGKEIRTLFVKTDDFAPTISAGIRARIVLDELASLGIRLNYQYMTMNHEVQYTANNGSSYTVLNESTDRTQYHMINVTLFLGFAL